MNPKLLLDELENAASLLYPNDKSIAVFCKKIIGWEVQNSSLTVPRYRDPYKSFLTETASEFETNEDDNVAV